VLNTFLHHLLWGGGKWLSPKVRPIKKKEGETSMLTAKQEAFCQNIIQGMSQADAYRSAYPNQKMSDKTIHEKASLLASNDKVVARVKELRDKLANEKIMTAQERMEWLTRLVMSAEASNTDKLKALDILNKMDGEYVQKIAAEVQTETTINIELVDDDEC
jgi:phage terminase small subunit